NENTTLEDMLNGWTQCCYLVPKKNRLCNISRIKGSNYCGNHQHLFNETREEGKEENVRIPCPIDGTHTIYAKNLKSHVAICNKTKADNEIAGQIFYRKDCNS